MRGGVHRGADHLRVVQVETAYVERHVVAAERTGDDPPAAFAQQRQSLTDQVPGDDVEADVDAVRGGGADLPGDVPGPVDYVVRSRFTYRVDLRSAADGEHPRTPRTGELHQRDADSPDAPDTRTVSPFLSRPRSIMPRAVP